MRLAAPSAVLALGLVAGCTDDGPAVPPGDEPTGVLVAVGDSVAAGAGDPAGGYPVRLAGLLEQPTACDGTPCPPMVLHQLAEGGATTGSLIEGGQLATAAELLRASPAGAARVVTVTVGGNDVVGPLATACADGVTEECAAAVTERYATVQQGLQRILGTAREAGGDDAVLAVMTYYDSFAGCDLAALSPLVRRVLDGDPSAGLPSFNGLLAEVAGAHGAVVVGTRDLVGADELVGGRDCLHPDADGHARIAGAFADAVGPQLGRR